MECMTPFIMHDWMHGTRFTVDTFTCIHMIWEDAQIRQKLGDFRSWAQFQKLSLGSTSEIGIDVMHKSRVSTNIHTFTRLRLKHIQRTHKKGRVAKNLVLPKSAHLLYVYNIIRPTTYWVTHKNFRNFWNIQWLHLTGNIFIYLHQTYSHMLLKRSTKSDKIRAERTGTPKLLRQNSIAAP